MVVVITGASFLKRLVCFILILFLLQFSYQIMRQCWMECPSDRPIFKYIVRSLDEMIGRCSNNGRNFTSCPVPDDFSCSTEIMGNVHSSVNSPGLRRGDQPSEGCNSANGQRGNCPSSVSDDNIHFPTVRHSMVDDSPGSFRRHSVCDVPFTSDSPDGNDYCQRIRCSSFSTMKDNRHSMFDHSPGPGSDNHSASDDESSGYSDYRQSVCDSPRTRGYRQSVCDSPRARGFRLSTCDSPGMNDVFGRPASVSSPREVSTKLGTCK